MGSKVLKVRKTSKQMLSVVLAGTMLVSMMPTTAFAKGDISAVAKVVGAMEVTKAEVEANNKVINEMLGSMPELQIKVKETTYKHTSTGVVPEEMEVTVALENATFMENQDFTKLISVRDDDNTWAIENGESKKERLTVSVDQKDIEEDEVTFTFNGNFEEDDILCEPSFIQLNNDRHIIFSSTVEKESSIVSSFDLPRILK